MDYNRKRYYVSLMIYKQYGGHPIAYNNFDRFYVSDICFGIDISFI